MRIETFLSLVTCSHNIELSEQYSKQDSHDIDLHNITIIYIHC